LEVPTAADVLLRVGVLSGWIGRSRQIEGAQEAAKDLISQSIAIFEKLDKPKKVAEALTELGYCYWREGAHDEARVTLANALSRIEDIDVDLKAITLVRCAIVEASATRFHDTLRILTEAAPFAEASTNHSVKGRFHVELATVLKNLGAAERREDYIDRALVEYTAASYHFERAGHTRYYALVENNLGYLFSSISKFNEAHEHLDRARRVFAGLKDSGSVAQVDETRARVLLGQGRNSEAEKVIRGAVRTLEKGGENALLAEALTTHGMALARSGQRAEARLILQRAMEVAEPAGDAEGAGVAALTIIEELGDNLPTDELSRLYKRADYLLSRSQNAGIVDRLLRAARRIVLAQRERTEEFSPSSFIYAEEQTAQLLHDAYRVAGAQGTVLITGETGTGKEILARLIHDWSGRAGALVAINCATLSDTLVESQLFGHKKGSFTDAIEDYSGVARQAAGGTLFLDEVAELSPANQSKLLRLIEHGEIHTIGAAPPERIDVRIIAATNRDLEAEVAGRRFRNDLFYRLQTFRLEIPPLRARPEDIPVIAEHFIKEATERLGKRINFTPEALAAMKALPLKGNAHELGVLSL
ncbi:MAG: sigma 54-interacting transcriptional regulator, partial [Acidobacteria bacterium]|nr:sigma 54-interacting transcriptional regulator [Acidobacteriota bacterium]